MGTTGYKAPNQADKIGRIKFTNAQLAAMMLLVDSPVWEILKIKYQSQRSVKIALTCLNAAIEDKDLWFCSQGRFKLMDRLQRKTCFEDLRC